jgi:hypothetical protein
MTKVNVEVIPGDRQKPAEDPLLLEPFFRTRAEAIQIQRLKTFPERKAVADAYAEIGCLRCQTKKRPHSASGLCTACRRWYANVLQRKIRARQRGETE